nr:3-hydroxyacyl-CoA dehydrogenase NAD-binding domain-containing protein [uncultured Pseudomonas sp.]
MSERRIIEAFQDDVAVLTIDNPPVNAGSLAVRQQLLEAIERNGADPAIKAIVIIGGGKSFIAGSDLREFGQPLEAPQLPQVIEAIENCPKPVIAALHGAALGGGYELALGCDARIASKDCVVGLPEVTLGMIPGAGGTQRLPRLVGAARAIELICAGQRVKSTQALAFGMVDVLAVDQSSLLEAAVAFAKGARKRLIKDLSVPQESAESLERLKAQALRKGRGRPAVLHAIDSVLASISQPIDQALKREREIFQHLRLSPEAAALRHLFFAERGAGKVPSLANVKSSAVNEVGVIGAGTMGAGIAVAFLDGGFNVTLVEQTVSALAAGKERIEALYARQLRSGRLTPSEVLERLQRLAVSCDISALSGCELVVEAVFEDISVKVALVARLSDILHPNALIATNTSYLDLDEIALASERPGNVCGLHFFSPANVMSLLEVVRSSVSTPRTLATALMVARRLGKVPVVAKNSFGFIGNRIYAAYRRQAEYLLEEGAGVVQVDSAMEAFGFAMGPFAVADLSGLDIAWRMRKAIAHTRDPVVRYVRIPDLLCEAGHLGRKTGAGYYRYNGDEKTIDPYVEEVVRQERKLSNKPIKSFTDEDIQERLLLAIVSEATLLLAEKVAQKASDIDVVLVNGYGFPRWEGGPMFWASRKGPAYLEGALVRLAQASPGVPVATIEQMDVIFQTDPAH